MTAKKKTIDVQREYLNTFVCRWCNLKKSYVARLSKKELLRRVRQGLKEALSDRDALKSTRATLQRQTDGIRRTDNVTERQHKDLVDRAAQLHETLEKIKPRLTTLLHHLLPADSGFWALSEDELFDLLEQEIRINTTTLRALQEFAARKEKQQCFTGTPTQ